ncbi:acyl-ACP thioesterase domain-containing protein [uncultured Flavobacterium sp.]|uniref:acyl-[acyl-carrier-protein] thioesterase n=1 Tax=uncultured Flavobacterium sp. TaxID=165435 RepID=UPI0030C84E94
MQINPNFTSTYKQEFELTFLNCYPNGLLKYTDLCNFIQIVAGNHADLGGISYSDMQTKDQAWVVSRMRVEISKLPKWRDVVTMKTWIKSLENSRSIRCMEMYLNGEKIMGCETYWVVINTKTRRPENLALNHDHFQLFDINATVKPTEKISTNEEFKKVGNKLVVFSDLDIVNHANNVKYLEWCLDFENSKKLLKSQVKAFDMNFMRELNLNDEAEIRNSSNENESTFTLSKDDKVAYALKIEWK